MKINTEKTLVEKTRSHLLPADVTLVKVLRLTVRHRLIHQVSLVTLYLGSMILLI